MSDSDVQFVPLLMAVPRTNTSVTSQQEFLECPSIEFIADGQQGIRLLDALQGDLTALQDGDDEVMHASSAKVSYRVEVGLWCINLSSFTDA